MKFLRIAALAAALSGAAWAQNTYSLGEGAPTPELAALFEQAYFRGDFPLYASLPPLTAVTKLGSTGLQQLLNDANKTGARLALVKADSSKPVTYTGGVSANDVYQLKAGPYSAFSAIGVTSAGYPTNDTTPCPLLETNSCEYNYFTNNHAVFVYMSATGLVGGTAVTGGVYIAVKGSMYTAWTAFGGLPITGLPLSAQVSATSTFATAAADRQVFQIGIIFLYTSGTLNGRSYLVREPFATAWMAGGDMTRFGFPVAEEVKLPDGRRRQSFEGGVLETAADGSVITKTQIRSIAIPGAPGPFRMKAGERLQFRAAMIDADGQEVSDRIVAWTSSNGRVAAVEQPQGVTTTVRAVAAGTANLVAVSEGKVSAAATIVVSSPCCQAGEGASTAALTQAFQDAITRNRLSLTIPAASPARRAGAGFVQEFLSTQTPPVRYVIAAAESLGVGFYLTGAILARYEEFGGPTGPLGYPTSDPTAGGRQSFMNRAVLAGYPVRLVSGTILDRWKTAGYESGAAGSPAGEPQPFTTFTGSAGTGQAFMNAWIYSGQAGPQAGRTFLVAGPILVRYMQSGGPAGSLGMPVGEAIVIDGRRRQDFEGGRIEQGPDGGEATATEKERQPSITATPNPVPAGGRVRIAIGGFPNGSSLRITPGAQAAFAAEAPSGAYVYTLAVPANARTETVRVRAASLDGTLSAEGAYEIKALSDLRLTLTKTAGDGQSGAPGAVLPVRLRVVARDGAGTPVPNVPVIFQASAGAAIVSPSRSTDEDGEAEAGLRLPPGEGVALATASISGQTVTFTARGSAVSLGSFPRLSQDVPSPLGSGSETIAKRGALLVSAASILRYFQDRRELPAPNGLADPLVLNQYLRTYCNNDPAGRAVCDGFLTPPGTGEQVVNLWRLPSFVAGAATVKVEKAGLDEIRDLVTQGRPVLVALNLLAPDGKPGGSHFVVATGISSSGAILIYDPAPHFGKYALDDFLREFPSGGRTWRGEIAAVVRLTPGVTNEGGLLASGAPGFELYSAAGPCPDALQWQAAAADGRPAFPESGDTFFQRFCTGDAAQYMLEAAAAHRLTIFDLGVPASRQELTGEQAASYRMVRAPAWQAGVPQLELAAVNAVVNAATLSPALAPGSLAAIFGTGLSLRGAAPAVEIGGRPVPVTVASAFRIHAAIPADLPPGPARVAVGSAAGSAEAAIILAETAPAIFLYSPRQGAVFNSTGEANGPESPVARGGRLMVYATGLGAVSGEGAAARTVIPVRAFLGGTEATVSYAGPASGFPGVYQVNLALPASTPPGIDLPLALAQGEAYSNTVLISVR